MTPLEAKRAVSSGRMVECEAEEYADIRAALQSFAGESIDTNQDIYAQIALSEVKRLDDLFQYNFGL